MKGNFINSNYHQNCEMSNLLLTTKNKKKTNKRIPFPKISPFIQVQNCQSTVKLPHCMKKCQSGLQCRVMSNCYMKKHAMNPIIQSNVYPYFLKENYKKSRVPFSKEEDEKIISLTKIHGTKKWGLIASFVPGRSPKQCRDRYSNYLVPGFFKGEWSREDDELLIKLYHEIGPKWSIIQKSFPERSSNSVKNRWNYFLCRQNLESSKNESFAELEIQDQENMFNDDFDETQNMDYEDYLNIDNQNESAICESYENSMSEINTVENDAESIEIINSNLVGYDNEWAMLI